MKTKKYRGKLSVWQQDSLKGLLLNFFIRPPPGLLPVLGPLERYMTPTLDAALLCSFRAGSDPGRKP